MLGNPTGMREALYRALPLIEPRHVQIVKWEFSITILTDRWKSHMCFPLYSRSHLFTCNPAVSARKAIMDDWTLARPHSIPVALLSPFNIGPILEKALNAHLTLSQTH